MKRCLNRVHCQGGQHTKKMPFQAFIAAPLALTSRPRTAITRTRPLQPQACAQCMKSQENTDSVRPSSKLSAERRRKISESLKGRRLSAEHRLNLSASLRGSKNPNYGRRLSPETRAKIGAAVSAASKRKRKAAASSQKQLKNTTTENRTTGLGALRDKALESRLLTGAPNSSNSAEARTVEAILSRVRAGVEPPEAVARGRQAGKFFSAANKLQRECKACVGSGYEKCSRCAGKFGTVSARCDACLGAGSVFCRECLGAGVGLQPNGAARR